MFTGCIPLKPGQLFDTDLADVTLWDGVTEIGITVSALWPRHPDGSVKVIRVSATLTLAAATQHNYTLRLGTARTQSGPTEPVITGAWMKNPRLIACTDASHLCSSRVAVMPLVPIPHPNLPAQWNTFLTTQWDDPNTSYISWGRIKAEVMADVVPSTHGGTANYNALSAVYIKYLTSGELDRLNEAHHLAQYAGGYPSRLRDNVYCSPGRSKFGNAKNPGASPLGASAVLFYGAAYQSHTQDETFPVNPEGYTSLRFQMLDSTEWNSGVYTDYYMCYCLSGWLAPREALLPVAASQFSKAVSGAFPGPANNSLNYTGRFQWRGYRGADIFWPLLCPPMSLYFQDCYNRMVTLPPPCSNWSAYQDWLKRNHFDIYEADGLTFPRNPADDKRMGGTAPYLYGSWMGNYTKSSGDNQWIPNVQYSVLFLNCVEIYLNILQDARVPAQMVKIADIMLSQEYGPISLAPAHPTVRGYVLRYVCLPHTKDPSYGFWGNAILLPVFTYAWAFTKDQKYLDVADLHSDNRTVAVAGGKRAGSSGFKELGEIYAMAFHAAAWRAGVPADGWDIP